MSFIKRLPLPSKTQGTLLKEPVFSSTYGLDVHGTTTYRNLMCRTSSHPVHNFILLHQFLFQYETIQKSNLLFSLQLLTFHFMYFFIFSHIQGSSRLEDRVVRACQVVQELLGDRVVRDPR